MLDTRNRNRVMRGKISEAKDVWYSNRRKSGKVPIEPEMKLKLNELGLG